MGIKSYHFLTKINHLAKVGFYNTTHNKYSTRADSYIRMLKAVNVNSVNGEKSLSNKNFRELIFNSNMADSCLKTSLTTEAFNCEYLYREAFYDGLDERIKKLIAKSNPNLSAQEIQKLIRAAKFNGAKINICGDVFIKELQKDEKRIKSHSNQLCKKFNNNWLYDKVCFFTNKNTKRVEKYKESIKKAKNTPKKEPNPIFASFSSGVKKTFSELKSLFKSQNKVEHNIRKNKLKVLATRLAISTGVLCAAVFGLSKQSQASKEDAPNKNNTIETVANWQKVSNTSSTSSMFYQAAAKVQQEKAPLSSTSFSKEIVEDSKRILGMWVKKDNLNNVINSLVSQGLTQDQAITYAHLAALCGSKTLDNNLLKDVNGKKAFSNGNHTMFGAKAMEEVGISAEQRNAFAKSVDFKNSTASINKETITTFNKISKYLAEDGALNLACYAKNLSQGR